MTAAEPASEGGPVFAWAVLGCILKFEIVSSGRRDDDFKQAGREASSSLQSSQPCGC